VLDREADSSVCVRKTQIVPQLVGVLFSHLFKSNQIKLSYFNNLEATSLAE
jgi:hypothetical protein